MVELSALLHEAHWRARWRAVLLLLMAVAAWFAFAPPQSLPADSGHDKINHLLAFGAMGVAAALALVPGPRSALLAMAGLLLYGGFIELVQGLLPLRQASWADLLADALGSAAGLLAVHALRRWRPLRWR